MLPNSYHIHTLCIECKEAISNPICPSCLEKEIIAWLSKENMENSLIAQIKEKVALLIKQNKGSLDNAMLCIVCKKKNSFICPSCFSKYIYGTLRNPKIKQFLPFLSYY